MVSDQDLAQALESLLREASPNTTFTSLYDVVHQLESKLGLDLSHKVDFIRNHIQFLLRPPSLLLNHPSPPPPPSLPPHKDHFALKQSPLYHPAPSPQNFTLHSPQDYAFPSRQSPPFTKIETYASTTATTPPPPPAVIASPAQQPAAQPPKKRSNFSPLCLLGQ